MHCRAKFVRLELIRYDMIEEFNVWYNKFNINGGCLARSVLNSASDMLQVTSVDTSDC